MASQISAISWYGGKAKMAKQIIGLMESTRYTNYVEVFGGGAHVILNKKRDKLEVYNDINKGLVSLFSVLRDAKRSKELLDQLQLTMYAREEFNYAKLNWDKEITRIDDEIIKLQNEYNENFIDDGKFTIQNTMISDSKAKLKDKLDSGELTTEDYNKAVARFDKKELELKEKLEKSKSGDIRTNYEEKKKELEKERDQIQIETARMFYVLCQQSFSAGLESWKSDKSVKSGTLAPAMKRWLNGIDEGLPRVIERFRSIYIENMSYEYVIEKYDSPDTLFYIDPPYIHDTRGESARSAYMYEFADGMHVKLVEQLQKIQGKYILSGYDHEIYNPLDNATRHLPETKNTIGEDKPYAKVKLDDFALSCQKTEKGEKKDFKEEYLWINFVPGSM